MAETASSTLCPEDQELENFALDSLRHHLQTVTDARAEHGKIHKLLPVLCLVVLGLLTGRTSLSQILALAIGAGAGRHFYGDARRRRQKQRAMASDQPPAPWLFRIGLLWRGRPTAPCLMTLIRLLDDLRLGELQEAMAGWVLELLAQLREPPALVVRVDGKAMKAADRHILSVFVEELRLVLLHEEVDEKKNELSTFRDKLSALLERYPFLWLLSGDAMFADTKLCELLKAGQRHWLFQIKANQPQLLEKLELVFSPIVHAAPQLSSEPEKKRWLCGHA
jgi:hypothetical protein